MKEFGYSSAVAVGLLVVTAGLSLAAVIANLPLQGKAKVGSSWKPGSDRAIVSVDGSEPLLSQPIEDSFLVSFDPGADLQDVDFVAMSQQQSANHGTYTIQSEQIEALAALSPAAGQGLTSQPRSETVPLAPAEDDATTAKTPPAWSAAAALVPDSIEPPRASAELRERSRAAPQETVSLALVPPDPPLPADAPQETDAASRHWRAGSPLVVEPQRAAIPTDPAPAEDTPAGDTALTPQDPTQPDHQITSRTTPEPDVTPAGYVVIGSFRRLDEAAVHVSRYQHWQPTIVAGTVDGKLYRRVVVGPFSEADLQSAWKRIVDAGVKDAWRLIVSGETDLAVKALDGLG